MPKDKNVRPIEFAKIGLLHFSNRYQLSIQATKSLYPSEITIAPVNKPIKPERIKPPTTPKNMTSIGTGAPFPNKTGFRTLSEILAINR